MSYNNKVITLGCRLNFWESDKINNLIQDKENIVVFNTCSVTNEAIKNAKKDIKVFHKKNPKIKIVVTGCAVESDSQAFKDMSEVSYLLKNKDKLSSYKWRNIKNNISSGEKNEIIFNKLNKENPSNSSIRKFIKIQNGCDHSCTFCIIPRCRGKSESDSIEKINKEVAFNLNKGVKEIILTGVDLTSWQDYNNKNFKLGDLIENIFAYNKFSFRLRLSSIDAAEIDDKLMHLIKHESRLMPHFHFSLQSLDDLILKRMKRRHNVSQITKLINEIIKNSSNATFGADFICGFPTENDKMFNNTLKNVEMLNISHLHVFPYSERASTPAARMPQVPLEVRKNRAKELRSLGEKNYQKLLKKQVYKKHTVLIETDTGIGKTENNFVVKIKGMHKGKLATIMPNKVANNQLVVN